ncbi:type II toxin-antitoxin system PemK/MazF family toxin [Bartonella sp. A5(2022)]|nr:type II toxin-antitoxin system PemK/MazF family toxin [Bartonella sp. A05]MCZ2203681.1 type II toxin-antitoxin system PemK/MazF family toxin [Bartonella sp. A05]
MEYDAQNTDESNFDTPCTWQEYMQKRDFNKLPKKLPRIKPRIRSAPRIRQVFWCDFPHDVIVPEFWKQRLVLVISTHAKLHRNVTILPLTTQSQADNPAAYPIQSPINNKKSWVICDYITTVSVSRLSAPSHIKRLSKKEFNKIIALMHKHLPRENY